MAPEPEIFLLLQHRKTRRWGLYCSVLGHLVLIAWMLYPSTPVFVSPSATLAGKNGSSTIYLYQAPAAAKATVAQELNTEEYRHLILPPARAKDVKGPRKHPNLARTPQELHQAESAQTNSPPAGSLHGSLAYGESDGAEVRPAIRVSGSEPAVSEFDLAGVKEGNIVVEVTIDERGNIIQKMVLQSLNPAIDQKVLAALEDWHFLPALRDGGAIASKQDVYYHFPIHR